jgi:hypothetical protein
MKKLISLPQPSTKDLNLSLIPIHFKLGKHWFFLQNCITRSFMICTLRQV